jgi:hypothetical protein
MSTITRIIMEAERTSALEAMWLMREEALRASLARKTTALRQEPAARQVTRQGKTGMMPIGTPITNNNSSGQPEVRVVGRARPAKPIQSVKSKIVPEPDQIQSRPPVRPDLPHRT